MEEIEIIVEQLFPSGDLLLSTIYRDNYYKFRYFDYTEEEARELFIDYVKEEDAKILRGE